MATLKDIRASISDLSFSDQLAVHETVRTNRIESRKRWFAERERKSSEAKKASSKSSKASDKSLLKKIKSDPMLLELLKEELRKEMTNGEKKA